MDISHIMGLSALLTLMILTVLFRKSGKWQDKKNKSMVKLNTMNENFEYEQAKKRREAEEGFSLKKWPWL